VIHDSARQHRPFPLEITRQNIASQGFVVLTEQRISGTLGYEVERDADELNGVAPGRVPNEANTLH
jgi:hypothetical protein